MSEQLPPPPQHPTWTPQQYLDWLVRKVETVHGEVTEIRMQQAEMRGLRLEHRVEQLEDKVATRAQVKSLEEKLEAVAAAAKAPAPPAQMTTGDHIRDKGPVAVLGGIIVALVQIIAQLLGFRPGG